MRAWERSMAVEMMPVVRRQEKRHLIRCINMKILFTVCLHALSFQLRETKKIVFLTTHVITACASPTTTLPEHLFHTGDLWLIIADLQSALIWWMSLLHSTWLVNPNGTKPAKCDGDGCVYGVVVAAGA